MRRVLFFTVLLFIGSSATALAQTKGNSGKGSRQTVARQNTAKQKSQQADATAKASGFFLSIDTSQAYGPRSYSIADPMIRMLNQKANGKNVQISSSGIVGVPNGTYGFANGKLFLRQTTATSSGTIFGSGAVGTGTTLMGVGTGANTPGLNGKTLAAGPAFWGMKLPLRNLPASDSISRKK